MPPKIHQFRCKHCNKVRQSFDEEMQFCSTDCSSKFEYYEKAPQFSSTAQKQKDNFKSHILYPCVVCGQETSSKKFCSHGCSASFINKKRRDSTIKKSKETFVKEKKKSRYSLDQLNRMAEWKRVFDDESWLKRFKAQRN